MNGPDGRPEWCVRLASEDHARAIAEINVAAWRAAYAGTLPGKLLDEMSAEELEREWRTYLHNAESSDERLWVVLGDGRVVGYARTGPARDGDEALRLTGEIFGFYVHPESWGRGAGAALMDTALDDLAGRGFDTATLWVATANRRARAFYEHLGWHADGRDDKPFHGAPQLRYRRSLAPETQSGSDGDARVTGSMGADEGPRHRASVRGRDPAVARPRRRR